MKNSLKFLFGLVLLFCVGAQAQTALTSTTLASAVTSTSSTKISVASATGIVAATPTVTGSGLYVDKEFMVVTGVSSTTISVIRGAAGTAAVNHVSGAIVIIGPRQSFVAYDPDGACTAANTAYTPTINVRNGYQWLCSTVTGVLKWVPGFNNPNPPEPTVAVASAAGQITPSGPLFHVTGTAAITGFVLPVGFQKGTFCTIPDGIFTTTTANNIALASTAVVSKILCFTYDKGANKLYPTY